jgi:hypothetical protein
MISVSWSILSSRCRKKIYGESASMRVKPRMHLPSPSQCLRSSTVFPDAETDKVLRAEHVATPIWSGRWRVMASPKYR